MVVRRVKCRVLPQSYSRQYNYSVWVDWTHFAACGKLPSPTNARYICRDDAWGVQCITLRASPSGCLDCRGIHPFDHLAGVNPVCAM